MRRRLCNPQRSSTKLSCPNNPGQSSQQCPPTTRVSVHHEGERWDGPKRERRHAHHWTVLCAQPWILDRMLTSVDESPRLSNTSLFPSASVRHHRFPDAHPDARWCRTAPQALACCTVVSLGFLRVVSHWERECILIDVGAVVWCWVAPRDMRSGGSSICTLAAYGGRFFLSRT